MSANRPAGPSKFLVAVFFIGMGLLLVAFLVPSVHSLWQVLLGGSMAVFSLGRMVAR